jgi:hypothetical protein
LESSSQSSQPCNTIAASDKVYQLLANGRWFSPGTPASSTTKTGRHDIADILLKVALNTMKQTNKNIHYKYKFTNNMQITGNARIDFIR